MAQSDNERLNSKVSYLNSINEVKDQEIANLSELSKEKEREIERLQKSTSNIAEPHPVHSEAEHPPAREGNIIPDEYKEDGQEEESAVQELGEQIRSLTSELERREEENRQLMVERVNLQGELVELQQLLAEKEPDEDLHQHLVEADRVNLELE